MTDSGDERTTVTLKARGCEVTVPRVRGNLFVCSTDSEGSDSGCNTGIRGRTKLGREVWSEEWTKRKLKLRCYLTFTDCLGPCLAGNVALLVVDGRQTWFKDLNSVELVPKIFDYIERTLESAADVPLTPPLDQHVFDRYLYQRLMQFLLIGDAADLRVSKRGFPTWPAGRFRARNHRDTDFLFAPAPRRYVILEHEAKERTGL